MRDWLESLDNTARETGDPTLLVLSFYARAVLETSWRILAEEPSSMLSMRFFDCLALPPTPPEIVPVLDEEGTKIARAAKIVAGVWQGNNDSLSAGIVNTEGLQAPLFIHSALVLEIRNRSFDHPLPVFITPVKEFIDSLKEMLRKKEMASISMALELVLEK